MVSTLPAWDFQMSVLVLPIPWLIHLGAVYDTPHGVACAMMLPIVMEYNAECTGEKYREIARAMGVKDADSMTLEEVQKSC